MGLSSWLRNGKRSDSAPSTHRRPRTRATFRPQLGALEDRCLPSYGAPTTFAVGAGPHAVVTADVNGDGILDLITANTDGVSVLLSKKNGLFASAQNYAVPGGAAVAVGDVNGDGKPDIITGWGGVLLNNGNGTFRSGPTSNGILGYFLALTDVNGDGKLDVVAANHFAQTINVRLGNGDGTFGAASTLTTSDHLVALAVGKFDGKVDIVVGTNSAVYATQNGGEAQGLGSITLSLLPGNGDGTFGAAQTITSDGDSDLEGLTVADFNGDGKLDIAYLQTYDPLFGYGPAVLGHVVFGNGDGTFLPVNLGLNAGFSIAPGSGIGLAAADVNGDGKLDLIAVGSYGFGGAVADIVYGGSGSDQTFALGVYTPTAFAVGDFNGDGHADLAVLGAPSRSGYIVDVYLWSTKK